MINMPGAIYMHVRDLTARLDAAGVKLPAETRRAVDVIGAISAAPTRLERRTPSPGELLAAGQLDTMGRDEIADCIIDTATAVVVAERVRRLSDGVADAASRRALCLLRGGAERIIGQLRPSFDAAVDQLRTAHDLGAAEYLGGRGGKARQGCAHRVRPGRAGRRRARRRTGPARRSRLDARLAAGRRSRHRRRQRARRDHAAGSGQFPPGTQQPRSMLASPRGTRSAAPRISAPSAWLWWPLGPSSI